MNSQQRKYAIDRINTLVYQKEEAIKVRHTTPASPLTCEQMRAALREGRFTVTDDVFYRSSDLCRVVEFHEYVAGRFDEKSAKNEIAIMKTEAAKIKDQLMLGDAKQALDAIEKFRDFA